MGDGFRARRPCRPEPAVLVLACCDLDVLAWYAFRPSQLDGPYACSRCGASCVPCDACGQPAMCGDFWCRPCQPDG